MAIYGLYTRIESCKQPLKLEIIEQMTQAGWIEVPLFAQASLASYRVSALRGALNGLQKDCDGPRDLEGEAAAHGKSHATRPSAALHELHTIQL